MHDLSTTSDLIKEVRFITNELGYGKRIGNSDSWVAFQYGDVRMNCLRFKPIEAVHFIGQTWEVLHMKVMHRDGSVHYYHGCVDNQTSKAGMISRNCRSTALMLPYDSMSYGMAYLEYISTRKGK